MIHTHRTRLMIVGVLACGLLTGGDGPRTPPMPPEAKVKLDAVIAAYRALPGYADHGEITLVVKVGDRSVKTVQKANIAFARPNRLRAETEMVQLFADGSSVTEVVVPLKKYMVTKAPQKLAESSMRSGPLGAVDFGGLAGRPLVHVLNLVIGVEPERLLFDFTPRILDEPDQMVDGVSYRVLRLDESDNHDWRFLIDPKTGLVAFVDLVIEGDAARSSIAGNSTHIESLRWASGTITTETPAAETFRFQPTAGMTAVAKLEADPLVK